MGADTPQFQMIHHPPDLKLTVRETRSQGSSFVEIDLRTTRPLKVWSDTCEWGYDSLLLLIRDQHGVIHKIRRKSVSWRKNVPKALELDPGHDTQYCKISDIYSEWPGVASVTEPVTYAFEFVIPSDPITHNMDVWTGSIRSRWRKLP